MTDSLTTAARTERKGLGHIAPLDGVRAIAVLAVMAYHAGVPGLGGGFLGVDIFFVLSGFLITTLLVTEAGETARVRLGAFWARRARRLLPALVLVVLFVAAYNAFIVPPGTFPRLRADGWFTLFYLANWHFIFSKADYWVGAPSPLNHTWSLAVEEQFYLVWPLIVAGTLKLCRGRMTQALWWLLGISVSGALISATAMALLYQGGNTTRLYYGTDTHAQSVLVGVSLAIVLALVARQRVRAAEAGHDPISDRSVDRWWSPRSPSGRRWLTFVGFAGLSVAAVVMATARGPSWRLYHGGFLVMATATAAVLLAVVCLPRGFIGQVLALRPLRYLGRISYGMYLWHYPLFILMTHNRTGLGGIGLVAARFAATIVVAAASFHLVEQPIRQAAWARRRVGLAAAALGLATTGVILTLATPIIPAAAAVGAPVSDAVPAPTAPPRGADNVLLAGDSMALTLGGGLTVFDHQFGLNIYNDGLPGCSLATGLLVQQGIPASPAPACRKPNTEPDAWARLVAQRRPKVTVLLVRLDIVDRSFGFVVAHVGDPGFDAYLEGRMRLAVQVLSARGGKVVFLTSPYYDSGEQTNGQPWPEDAPARVNRFNAMLRQVAAEYPGRAFVINLNRLVDPAGHFQRVIDGVPVRYADGVHFTVGGGCWLAPRLLPQISFIARHGVQATAAQTRAMVRAAERTFSYQRCVARG